jgi:hypothetical protein
VTFALKVAAETCGKVSQSSASVGTHWAERQLVSRFGDDLSTLALKGQELGGGAGRQSLGAHQEHGARAAGATERGLPLPLLLLLLLPSLALHLGAKL